MHISMQGSLSQQKGDASENDTNERKTLSKITSQ